MSSTRTWEIYGITCPDTGKVVYVGCTVDGKRRRKEHRISALRMEKSPFYDWVRRIVSENKSFGYTVLSKADCPLFAAKLEKQWIHDLAKECVLLNVSVGGEFAENERAIGAYQESMSSEAALRRHVESESAARGREVVCLETGRIYASIGECARILGVDRSRVDQSCKKGYRVLGLSMRYKDEVDAGAHLPVRRRYQGR